MSEKPLQNQQEQKAASTENRTSRRAVSAGLAALGIGLFSGGEFLRRNWPDGDSTTEGTPDSSGASPLKDEIEPTSQEDRFEDATPDHSGTPVEQSEQFDGPLPTSLGNSEQLRDMTENEPIKVQIDYYQITTDEAPTPSAVAAQTTEGIGDWIQSGCNPNDIARHLADGGTLEEYKAEMASKYGVVAAAGLSGRETLDITNEITVEAIKQSPLFRVIDALHGTVLEWYMNAARDGVTDALSLDVALESHAVTSESHGMYYTMDVGIKATLSNGDETPLVQNGKLGLGMRLTKPTQPRSTPAIGTPEPGNRMRIWALSLNGEETTPFSGQNP